MLSSLIVLSAPKVFETFETKSAKNSQALFNYHISKGMKNHRKDTTLNYTNVRT